jgi:hypothetical protein
MKQNLSHRLLVAGFIVVLHLPLLYHALALYLQLPAGADISQLPAGSLVVLVALLLLPYAVLHVLGIRWNPPRARLNEPDA